MALAMDPGLFHGRNAPPAPEPGGRLSVAMVLPQGEGLALSTLGWQTVYRLLVETPGTAVERCFPAKGKTPTTLEGGRPLSEFHLLAFSLNFEEDYPGFVQTLTSSGVAPYAAQRPNLPLVLVGGPIAFLNPAPIAPFTDIFFTGEAEAGLADLAEKLRPLALSSLDKDAILEAVKDLPGVYVPGRTATPVRRTVDVRGGAALDRPGFSCFISSKTEFKDTLLLEVNRGCPWGCRFCAAGFVYRPHRQARLEDLQRIVAATRPPKVGLVGTALTDWPNLVPFLAWLKREKVRYSLSSVRADGLTRELVAELRGAGVRTLTLALEGASERLRRAANKNLDPGDFLKAVATCSALGVNHLKIYLIVGWPGETDEDYLELERFMAKVAETRDAHAKGKKNLMRMTLSAGCLTPKPFTPLQWAPMAPEAELKRRLAQVRSLAKGRKGLAVSGDSPARARLQGLLARGGEELAPFIALAASTGSFKRALADWRGDPALILDRERDPDEPFPWEVIDTGVSRTYLYKQYLAYKEAAATPPCPPTACGQCGRCGLDRFLASP